jgi:hypothetical protein
MLWLIRTTVVAMPARSTGTLLAGSCDSSTGRVSFAFVAVAPPVARPAL